MDKKHNQILEKIINNHWVENSLDELLDIVLIRDVKGCVIHINKYAEKVLGYKKKSIIGKSWIKDFIPKEDQTSIKQIWKKVLEEDSEFKVHNTNPVITKSGEILLISWSNVRIIEKDQIVAVLSIGHDVTNVYKLAEKLKESEEFLRISQEIAHIGSWTLDIRSNKLSWSDEVFRILGVKRESVFTYEDFLKLVHKDDRDLVNNAWSKAVAAKGAKTSDYEIVHRLVINGVTKWVREKATVFFDNRKPVKVVGTVEDITKQIEIEKRLLENIQSQKNVIDNMPIGVHLYRLNEKNELIFEGFSKKADEILKVDHSQFIGKEITKAFPSLLGTQIPEVYKKAARNGTPYHTEQINYKDKKIVGAFEVWAFQISQGKMAAMFLDITERKQISESIRENELKYRTLFESVGDGVFVMKDGIFIDCNENAAKLFGLKRIDLIGKNSSLISPKFQPDGSSSEESSKDKMKMALSGQPQVFYWQHKHSDNTLFYTEVSLRKMDLGKGNFLIASVRDVTDRLKLEKEITREKQLVDKIMMTSPVGIILTDEKGQITYANLRAEQILELSRGQIKTRKYNDTDWQALSLDEKPLANKDFPISMVLQKRRSVKNILHKIKLKDGRIKILSVSATPIFDDKNKINAVVAIVEDVTHDYEQEEKLRESEFRFSSFMKNVPAAVFIKDSDGRILYVNDEMNKIFGNKDWENKKTTDVINGYTGQKMTEDDRYVLSSNKSLTTEETITDVKGRQRIFNTTKFPITLSSKRKLLGGVAIDITQQKQFEQNLLESESKFRSYIENSPEGIMVADDKTLKYLDINPAISKITGYSRKEFLSMKIGDITFAPDLKIVREGIKKGLRGHFVDVTVRFVKKNGDIGWWIVSGRRISNGRFLLFAKDVTLQKIFEEKVQYIAKFPEENPNPVFRIGLDNTLLYANKMGKDLLKIFNISVNRKVRGIWTKLVKRAIEKKNVLSEEVKVQNETYAFNFLKVENEPYVNFYGRNVTNQKIAEQKLVESEERFRGYVENSPDGILVVDKNRKYIDVNSAIVKMTGFSKYEILKKQFSDVTYPEDASLINSAFENLIKSKDAKVEVTIRIIKKDGSLGWWIVTGKKLTNDRIMFFIREISEQKAFEGRYRSLFEGIKSGVAVYEPTEDGENFIFRDYNSSAEKLDKKPKKKVLGKMVDEVYPGVHEMGLFEVFKRVNRTGVPEMHPISIYKDKNLIAWRQNYVYKLPTGEIVAVYDDLTKERQISMELANKEKSLSALMSNLQGMVYRCKNNVNWTMLFVSDGCEVLTGYKSEELLNDKLITFNEIIHPDDRDYVAKLVSESIKKSSHYEMEYRIVTKSGKIKYVWEKGTLVQNDYLGGELEGLIVDITERREMELSLQKTKVELEKTNRDLTRLNNFMIGRELRMKELKMEVKRLKEKLGEE